MDNKQKTIAGVVIVLVIAVLAYMYIYKPKMEDVDNVDSETSTLQTQLVQLQQREAGIPKAKADTEEIKKQIQKYDEILEADVTQEEMVMLTQYLKDASTVKVKECKLEDYELVLEDAVTKEKVSSASITTTFEGTYDNSIAFLKYIRDYADWITISEFKMDFDNETHIIEGEATVCVYKLESEGREPHVVPDYPGIIGKEDLIDSYVVGEDELNLDGRYPDKGTVDVVIAASSPYADGDKVYVSTKRDLTGVTRLSSNANATADVVVNFGQEEDEYYISYTLDGKQSSRYFFNPNKSFEIDVYCQEILANTDKVKVNLSVNNVTDLPATIYIYAENTAGLRCNIVNLMGDVKVAE